MVHKLVLRSTLLVLCALSARASADDFKITNSKLQFNGFAYYRGKAEMVDLASYGEKKTPIDKVNYLAKQANIDRDKLAQVKTAISGPYTIEWSHYSDTDVNAAISYLTVVGGTAKFDRKKADSASLKLVQISVDGEGPLKKLLNDYATAARNYMRDEGNDARVASSVWVVMEGKLADAVKKCGSVSGKGTNGSVLVSIDVKSCSGFKSTIELPPETTFAYGLHKVKSWTSGKKEIENLEDDQADSMN
jgi:hypothetical protein